jgi:hypothetical protein
MDWNFKLEFQILATKPPLTSLLRHIMFLFNYNADIFGKNTCFKQLPSGYAKAKSVSTKFHKVILPCI